MIEILANVFKEINKLPKPDINVRFVPNGVNGIKFTAIYCEKCLDKNDKVKALPDFESPSYNEKQEKMKLMMLNATIDFDELMGKPKMIK